MFRLRIGRVSVTIRVGTHRTLRNREDGQSVISTMPKWEHPMRAPRDLLPARGRIIRGHSVPEVYWDGAWHLLDASLINYFPHADGRIAGVDELITLLRKDERDEQEATTRHDAA